LIGCLIGSLIGHSEKRGAAVSDHASWRERSYRITILRQGFREQEGREKDEFLRFVALLEFEANFNENLTATV
jgi:hypothetical protein